MTDRSGPEPEEPETGDTAQGTDPSAASRVATAAAPFDRMLTGRKGRHK